jgi:hypothetical protein
MVIISTNDYILFVNSTKSPEISPFQKPLCAGSQHFQNKPQKESQKSEYKPNQVLFCISHLVQTNKTKTNT